jgi:hypothetical protein
MKLTPTQIVLTNERFTPEGNIVDAQLAKWLATELEAWMARCRHVEELNDFLRSRNIALMDERDASK